MRTAQFIFLMLLGLCLGTQPQAQTFPSTPQQQGNQASQAKPDQYVDVRLLPQRNQIKAGEEIWIGVEQSIYPHWHTYWVNPGDSGAPSRIKWTLPNGFEIGEIQWPAPQKIPYDPLVNYGYEGKAVFLQKLKVPATLPDGPITLSADVEVLVCKDICIPEFSTHEMTLNVEGAALDDNSAYLNEARGSLPAKIDWSVGYGERNGNLVLGFAKGSDDGLSGIDLSAVDPNTIELFPLDWGIVDNTAPTRAAVTDGVLSILQTRGGRALSEIEKLNGVLAYTAPDGRQQSIQFTAQKDDALLTSSAVTDASAQAQTPQDAQSVSEQNAPIEKNAADAKTSLNDYQKTAQDTGFLKAILLAIIGGLVLNLMPCVFPVLSIKALSLVKIAEKHPEQARLHGMSYTLGVIISFLAIAGTLVALKLGGANIGWGFQLQNPVIITLLAYLLFTIGLNLSGVFEFGGGLSNVGGKLAQGHGYKNSFFTGILATIVATPCTAPFMGAALGYALFQPAIISLSVFAALGFGLALPYLLLSFLPHLQHILPKPGAWMDVFKQLLAFPMYLSAIWLVWVLSQQTGARGMLGALLGMIAIGFGVWLLSHRPRGKKKRITLIILAVLSFIMALGFLPSSEAKPDQDATIEQSSNALLHEPYSVEALNEALSNSDPVFVEMTAAWCITCKVNHASSINIKETRTLFKDNAVQYLVGDWTNQDPAITTYLDSFGRNGVPLYVYYGRADENGIRPDPVLMPQILTPKIVAKFVTNGA